MVDFLRLFIRYYLVEFYAARLTEDKETLDFSVLTAGTKAIQEEIKRLEYVWAEHNRDLNLRDNLYLMQLVLEASFHGIRFLPVDSQHSSYNELLPENGNIRLPLKK